MREHGSQGIRSVAVVGHGGSGKTSVVDALPFAARTSRPGRVGDARRYLVSILGALSMLVTGCAADPVTAADPMTPRSAVDASQQQRPRLPSRYTAVGCAVALSDVHGGVVTVVVPRRLIPFSIPRVDSAAGAGGRTVLEIVSVGARESLPAGGTLLGVSCLLPAGSSREALAEAVKESRHAQRWLTVRAGALTGVLAGSGEPAVLQAASALRAYLEAGQRVETSAKGLGAGRTPWAAATASARWVGGPSFARQIRSGAPRLASDPPGDPHTVPRLPEVVTVGIIDPFSGWFDLTTLFYYTGMGYTLNPIGPSIRRVLPANYCAEANAMMQQEIAQIDAAIAEMINGASQLHENAAAVEGMECERNRWLPLCIDFYIETEFALVFNGNNRRRNPDEHWRGSKVQLQIDPHTKRWGVTVNGTMMYYLVPDGVGGMRLEHHWRDTGFFVTPDTNDVRIVTNADQSFTVYYTFMDAFCITRHGCPHIDGEITFRPNASGTFDVGWRRDAYPTMDIFLYKPGLDTWITLAHDPETKWGSWLSWLTLIDKLKESKQEVSLPEGCQLQ